MHSAVDTTRLTPADVASVEQLVDQASRARGYRPVSDQFMIDLRDARAGDRITGRIVGSGGELIAYAQAFAAGTVWTVESVTADDTPINLASLGAALDATGRAVTERNGSDLHWLVQGPTPRHEALASARGMTVGRQLHQMRRQLPTGLDVDIETRAFDADRDLDEWVEVNKRAFAWNPEQGSWTSDSVRSRMHEPWFDANGFLIHERLGRLAGFCWTKLHDTASDADGPLGEIYVIAVDPDFHGSGLGRDLTLAGLDHLARRGARTGMLFVDADNLAAIRMYDRLGFVIHRTDTIFHGALT